jgi:hypothetical protein
LKAHQESTPLPVFLAQSSTDRTTESNGSQPVGNHSRTDHGSHGALSESELEASIARLARRLATAPDDEIVDLVAERKAMRGELDEFRRAALPPNVTRIR